MNDKMFETRFYDRNTNRILRIFSYISIIIEITLIEKANLQQLYIYS
jgi:hypothetical protein